MVFGHGGIGKVATCRKGVAFLTFRDVLERAGAFACSASSADHAHISIDTDVPDVLRTDVTPDKNVLDCVFEALAPDGMRVDDSVIQLYSTVAVLLFVPSVLESVFDRVFDADACIVIRFFLTVVTVSHLVFLGNNESWEGNGENGKKVHGK
jgi:hypothetical protein